MTTRMNFGSGSTQPEGWVNVDMNQCGGRLLVPELPVPDFYRVDIRDDLPPWWSDTFDYAVAHCSISDLDHHELGPALLELHRVLKPGGVLRVSVPDLLNAIDAWQRWLPEWFPQGNDLVDIGERFCTFLTWFGTVKSIFTPGYLQLVLMRAGFRDSTLVWHGRTDLCDDPEITSLDGDAHRKRTCFYMEGRK